VAPVFGYSLLPRLASQQDFKRELWRLVGDNCDVAAWVRRAEAAEEFADALFDVAVALAVGKWRVDLAGEMVLEAN
jgi:hypothetical protein